MKKIDPKSMDLKLEKIEKLKEIFPNIFNEGKIDFEEFKEEIGEFIDNETERYNFTWNGKTAAKRIALTPSTGTLRPNIFYKDGKENSKNFDTTKNLYIEGDNLEVLKLLQKSYHKSVKVIYIDPPYNTGKDFVYKDNFKDNIKNYLEVTGQVDSEGNKFSTNSDTSGRYHSDWLNMMYPRLKLARNLLKDDGVIFISIDDNEIINLKKLCDEIFGEDNFIEIFNWTKSETPANLSKKSKKITEYILCYQKNKNDIKFKGRTKKSFSSNGLLNQTNKVSRLVFPKNKVETNINDGVIVKGTYGTDSYEIILLDDTVVENGKFITDVVLEARFKWSQSKLNREIDEGTVIKIPTVRLSPSYEKLEYDPEVPPNLINSKVNVSTNENAGVELLNLMGDKLFDFPKPVDLIQYLIGFCIEDNDIILDFFSGSASTAHAVMKLNSEDSGNRKFILVQIPEETDCKSKAYSSGYINICEIGKERIRRAGKKILEESDNDLSNLDIGFKVLKLDSSNIKTWDTDYENLEQNLLDSVDNIKNDRTNEDLLYEILLKYGLDLTLPIEELNINGKKVYSIGFGALLVCLDNDINTNTIEQLVVYIKENVFYDKEKKVRHTRIVFNDNSFADAVVKTNSLQILKQHNINEVVSI